MRSALNYLFALAALVGVCLLAAAFYLGPKVGHQRSEPYAHASNVAVTAIVLTPPQTPQAPITQAPTPAPTADTRVPPDPGHGPQPVCWTYPGQGLAPGATCPPKPFGR